MATPAPRSPNSYNATAAADYIFLSVEGAYQGCTQDAGCVFGFNVTSGAVPTAPTAGSAAAGGTSAIVIDNAARRVRHIPESISRH